MALLMALISAAITAKIASDFLRDLSNEDYRFGAATHGYLPNTVPQPILLAKGPSIRKM